MNLLPEFRKASKLDASKSILFGTIDCAINKKLCEKFNIRSYPTTILFNKTSPHNYMGHHSAHDIADFIEVFYLKIYFIFHTNKPILMKKNIIIFILGCIKAFCCYVNI